MNQTSLIRFKSEDEARKRARDDIRLLLKQSGGRINLHTLQSLKEEIEIKKEENDRELVYMIDRKVQEIARGVQMLSEKEEVTRDIRAKIGNIKELWQSSCGRFQDISKEVDQLLQAKRHVEQVLNMLQNFLDMEVKVEELKSKLTDDEEIFNVYKKIKIMNFMRTSFLAKIEAQSHSGAPNDKSAVSAASKLQKIKEHFRAVGELERQFQETVIQGNLQNIYNLALKNPSLLVKVLRIIENEEITLQSLEQKYSQQEEEEKKRLMIEALNRDSEIHPHNPLFAFKSAKKEEEDKE